MKIATNALALLCFAGSFASTTNAGTFTGTAVDLFGDSFPTFPDLQVVVLSESGIPLSGPSTVNVATGTYTVSVNNADLARLGIVSVTLRFTAPERETVTLQSVDGRSNQTINVVLPEKKTVMPCCCRSYVRHRHFLRRCW